MVGLVVIALLQAAVVVWGLGSALLISTELTMPYQSRPKGWPWVIPLWPAIIAWELWGRAFWRKKRGR